MSFELILDPAEEIVFTREKTSIHMGNGMPRRVAFKVKCTTNHLFKIEPSVGFIQPSEAQLVYISYQGVRPVPGQKFSVSYMFPPDTESSPIGAWTKNTGPVYEKVLPATIC